MTKWQWILKQFGKRLWVRASMFCVLGVLTALVALIVRDYIPQGFSRKLGANAVDNLLQIIANSMLVVTTFSLSTMVAAFSAATNNVTPRSTQLLLEDSAAQNALSTFIGAFLFSLVGIVALRMQIYQENGRLILFAATIAVIVVIIIVLLKWISYLSRLGRVGDTIDMVENATLKALNGRIKNPYLGAVPLLYFEKENEYYPIYYNKIGYIQHLDIQSLSAIASDYECNFYLRKTSGSFNDSVNPILYSSSELDEKVITKICNAFSIADSRSFDQDPRFGLIVLGEIASRALSSAINDPGTAIDIIGTSVRILKPWVTNQQQNKEPKYKNIYVPPMETIDLFEDIYSGLARDGASTVQVGIRLQKALSSLHKMGNRESKNAVQKLSTLAYEYSQKSLVLDSEKELIKSLHNSIK